VTDWYKCIMEETDWSECIMEQTDQKWM